MKETLEYAQPPQPPPDTSNVPAYKRLSPAQIIIRFFLALLLAAAIFLIASGLRMAIFHSPWR
ncbi:MAG: hypothetical protein QOF78_1422 [Phycisphaerales bacterium]|jgi:hypothetical protein|nr:hypothetical protein [Phycisphaerales bacterium]